MTATPQIPSALPVGRRGWTRVTGQGWAEVAMVQDAGARVTAAVLSAFPGATVHGVSTDVLGEHRARIVTAGRLRVTVELDADFQVSDWCTEVTRRSRARTAPDAAAA